MVHLKKVFCQYNRNASVQCLVNEYHEKVSVIDITGDEQWVDSLPTDGKHHHNLPKKNPENA